MSHTIAVPRPAAGIHGDNLASEVSKELGVPVEVLFRGDAVEVTLPDEVPAAELDRKEKVVRRVVGAHKGMTATQSDFWRARRSARSKLDELSALVAAGGTLDEDQVRDAVTALLLDRAAEPQRFAD